MLHQPPKVQGEFKGRVFFIKKFDGRLNCIVFDPALEKSLIRSLKIQDEITGISERTVTKWQMLYHQKRPSFCDKYAIWHVTKAVI